MIKLGILGFGVVGKSALLFFDIHRNDQRMVALLSSLDYEITVWDQRELTIEELSIIEKAGARFVISSHVSLEQFFFTCDAVLASPGIDVRSAEKMHAKLVCELDVFSIFFTKPVIAITGTLGKTTTTALLGKLIAGFSEQTPKTADSKKILEQGLLRVAVGGNIGTGMLDLVCQSDFYDCAVLELSSWQLEYSRRFVPDVALWTNLYPNHLDRHESMYNYAHAKYQIFAGQKENQGLVLNADLFSGEVGDYMIEWASKQTSRIVLSCMGQVSMELIQKLAQNLCAVLSIRGENVVLESYEKGLLRDYEVIIPIDQLPSITFLENWLQIIAALYLCGLKPFFLAQRLPKILSSVSSNTHTKHRVEYCATVDDVDFYNDSKSTVIESTRAAVKKLAALKRPIIVVLGGLSKGADRSSLVPLLESIPQVKKIYSFGAAHDFQKTCYFPTLELVVADIMNCMQPKDIVLFSPSGSSYDLFENYQHRGEVFKELVLRHYNSV